MDLLKKIDSRLAEYEEQSRRIQHPVGLRLLGTVQSLRERITQLICDSARKISSGEAAPTQELIGQIVWIWLAKDIIDTGLRIRITLAKEVQ